MVSFASGYLMSFIEVTDLISLPATDAIFTTILLLIIQAKRPYLYKNAAY